MCTNVEWEGASNAAVEETTLQYLSNLPISSANAVCTLWSCHCHPLCCRTPQAHRALFEHFEHCWVRIAGEAKPSQAESFPFASFVLSCAILSSTASSSLSVAPTVLWADTNWSQRERQCSTSAEHRRWIVPNRASIFNRLLVCA